MVNSNNNLNFPLAILLKKWQKNQKRPKEPKVCAISQKKGGKGVDESGGLVLYCA